jgi:enoyl-CoA hydratase/carnithine racemase
MTAPTSVFDEYVDKYSHAKLRRENGILEIRLHSDGGEAVMGGGIHADFTALVQDIARDPDTRVVILTGTGDTFFHEQGFSDVKVHPERWANTHANTKRLITGLLSIEAPIIAAINGPATVHAEWGLLSDIVLAADHAYFQDRVHIKGLSHGLLPGDGVHIVWPLLLGLNRGRYFLLTGQKLSATEALSLGVVNEVMPKDELLPRAWELARELIEVPQLSLRLMRALTLQDLRRRMLDDLGYGLALEGLDSANQWIQKQ